MIEIAIIYLMIGASYACYLFLADRVEGDWGEFTFYTLVWPLCLGEWIERKILERRRRGRR